MECYFCTIWILSTIAYLESLPLIQSLARKWWAATEKVINHWSPSSGPSGLYPIGDSPAWAEIKDFIGQGAQAFIYAWVWDPDWDGVHKIASQHFVRFSREYFVTLKDDALRADAPSPTYLQEAMEAWVVVELSNTLGSLLQTMGSKEISLGPVVWASGIMLECFSLRHPTISKTWLGVHFSSMGT